MDPHLRLPKNAPGPFYTTGGCIACGAPEDAAPDLLAPLTDDNWETYFLRQPESPEETERACCAAEVCCLNSVRYGGTDPLILRRLGNRLAFCDRPLPGGPVRLPWETGAAWEAARRAWRLATRRWWQFWK